MLEALWAIVRCTAHFTHYTEHQCRQVLICQHVEVRSLYFWPYLVALIKPHVTNQQPLLAVISKRQCCLSQLIQGFKQVTASGIRLKTHRLPVINKALNPSFNRRCRFRVLDEEMLPARRHTRSGAHCDHRRNRHPALTTAYNPPVITGKPGFRIDNSGEERLGEQACRLARALGRLNWAGYLIMARSRRDKRIFRNAFLHNRSEVSASHQCGCRESVCRQKTGEEAFKRGFHTS